MGAGVLRGGEEAYAAYSSRAPNRAQCTWEGFRTRARDAGMRNGSRRSPGPVRAMRQRRPAGGDKRAANGRLHDLAMPAVPRTDAPHIYQGICAHVLSIFHEPADVSVTLGPQSRPGPWARRSGLQSPGGNLHRTCV